LKGSRDLLFEVLRPPPYLGTVKARNFKFGIQIGHWWPSRKKTQN